jgi:hypothetical protein
LIFPLKIDVKVTGVADVANTRTVKFEALEDQAYAVGSAIGDLTGILIDDDGSERHR